ncbi:hypothetical protein [Alkalihalobacterium alkalinitrilicum]|uniref:hypothetical protein n=1 Tax=Alkalihalobacterium alkalinitrilicum TaxID=427920 RepID=UPI001303ABD7|nr:hypothetical protein [Alkalihalobacterium alkalinitrilicum]
MKKFLCGLLLISALVISSPFAETADPNGSPRIQSTPIELADPNGSPRIQSGDLI